MATLSPQILLSQQPVKMPSLDFSQTFVDMAKIKAFQQQQRLEELKYGQLERGYARDEEFNRLAAGLFTQPQAQPGAAPPGRGLAGGPPAPPSGPPPAAAPSMAGQVPPALPGQSYAMAPSMAQGPPGPGGMPPSFTRAPEAMQPPAPFAGGQMPGMPPGIPAPTSMEPGTFTMAQGTPPPAAPVRGLAGGQPSASPGGVPAPPPPGEPPQGLGSAQPGAPKSLLQPINEDVLMRLYAANPEKASKLMEGHLGMQTKKLEQAEKMNEQIRQTLSAVERSPNPAKYYPEAIRSLEERGIPIPASFPREYDAGLVRFKLMEHETLKDQLDAAKIVHKNQETATARADELYKGAQARREGTQSGTDVATTALREAEAALAKAKAGAVPAEIKAAEALVGVRNAEAELAQARTKGVPADIRAAEALVEERKAQTARIPLQGEEDVARTQKLREETAALVNDRKAKLAQVTPYTTDSKKNIYLSQAAQQLNLPPGTPPTQEVLALAREFEVADEQAVVRKTGLDAAAKVLPEADAKRVQALSDKGTAMEGLQNTLDEVERLIGEGVYTNIPEQRIKQILADAGLRASDPIAARTARLYELGNELAIEKAGGKLGGQVSDTDLRAIQSAGGNFQSAKSALSMQESIKSMRNLAKIHLQDANSGWKRYKETNTLPRFGEAREERLKILTPERLEEVWQAKKAGWSSKEALRQHLLGQGFREE